jgi:hypothetical protein
MRALMPDLEFRPLSSKTFTTKDTDFKTFTTKDTKVHEGNRLPTFFVDELFLHERSPYGPD